MSEDDKFSVFRVSRGGGWLYDSSSARVAGRSDHGPGYRGTGLGFRLARLFSPLERLVEAGQEVRDDQG